ncbi:MULTISPECIES: type IV pilus twitching motility protein PilT [Uliginosibacterium]|uniref:Flp pilus assembly complex ATPase component TadA n=1 Tax=Uliginosibacterium aquaticum TaxID=2731212 RepID=A0ABX2IH71_9RHOO|nr:MULTISPECIES: ATPase, T2SS/T4P/T4SS family [Uliginosibacterium]MDO6386107.1 ATPase, T2SS/T4P/T4SS family [Uliginosibacterium sp. 31-12]NSL53711.1 Flp pilus assembly complex ATPase component TadA [Uliginosibacterium aquaticum]PLK49173.1 twitching motility protein [Uliginosibacterium sp. TH139]
MDQTHHSLIETLSPTENLDYPGSGTLIEQILSLLNSEIVFSDIIIHQNSPVMLRQPKRLVAVSDIPVTGQELEEFFEVIEPAWEERILERAFDRAKDLYSARLRVNCFSFHARKRLGCVIRRFPAEPLPLASLGLRPNTQAFAKFTSGLVLIVGDTCQGKSTTIASLLDEINKTRPGHIITIEDPVETLIPQRKSIITQREVGTDGDVASYYLGALDALRERPDVILIGEIRDAATAQEALALSEAGPLVLATLHARSTELGLQKMLRLLGNGEAQAQTLASSLRGVLCQALLPNTAGDGYQLATECLTVNQEAAHLIGSANFSGIRGLLDIQSLERNASSHTMNDDLLRLITAGKVSVEDARRASTDPLKFAGMVKELKR